MLEENRSKLASNFDAVMVAQLYELVKQYDADFKAPAVIPDPHLLNKDGTPRLLYHWTDAEFDEFDPSRSGSNQGKTHGDGIYLSTSRDEFSYAGSKRLAFYASVKNPFEMELTEKQADEVYDKYGAPFHKDKFGTYRPHAINALMSRFSRSDGKGQFVEMLKEAMENAPDERSRKMLRECLEEVR